MSTNRDAKFNRLIDLLKELFQLDQPDLDFGLYRIMRAKAAETSHFLEHELLPQVRQAFQGYQSADATELKRKLDELTAQVIEAGFEPDLSPKVKALREQLKGAVDVGALEAETYDHLFNFFRRYYDEGDFLAKRVYKPGVYAIPYEGEEVTLHWANKDQYYIKTSEYLRDYAFRLRPEADEAAGGKPMRVHFRLVDAAEGEHGNVKAVEGKDRVFILVPDDDAVTLTPSGELDIAFQYRPATVQDWPEDAPSEKRKKPPTQKELTANAVQRVLALCGQTPSLADWHAELAKPHVKADGSAADYSRLQGHLQRYTARNTFDYFIHKDLGGFLRRELDFYIKNEVMHLDDVENESAPKVEQYLSKIKVIRRIAHKLIDFLAQLEDFQKALWLKKKFVVRTDWCVALSEIPDAFHSEILANNSQRAEWAALYGIGNADPSAVGTLFTGIVPVDIEFIKANPGLMIDTRNFDKNFTARLIEFIDDLEAESNGLLIFGENYQSLDFISTKYKESISCIYIDPPYNTDASAIDYKNGYRHSSWLSLIDSRLQSALKLLSKTSILCITIDDIEVHWLACAINSRYPNLQWLGTAPIKNNPAGRTGTVGFSTCHEYAIFYGATEASQIGRLEHSAAQKARYKEKDSIGYFEWTNFRKHGGQNTYRKERPKQFYPIYVDKNTIIIPRMIWDNTIRNWIVIDPPPEGAETLLPIDESGRERIWDFGADTATDNLDHFMIKKDSLGKTAIYRKWRLNDQGLLPQTWWDKSEYSAAEYGTNLLTSIFGETHTFSFPKSVHAVVDSLKVGGMRTDKTGVVLDFFGGSGTTAHAVINLNREDGGRRKFVLVEMGHHFDTVLLPRIKKLAFTPDWKNGRPHRKATGEEVERAPRLIKVLRLESYEDTLNNLQLERAAPQQSLLDTPAAKGGDGLREQYLLRYQLNVEARGSASLLNVAAFADPESYRLSVKRPGSDESVDTHVDLVETFNYLIGLTVRQMTAPRRFTAKTKRDGEGRLRLVDGSFKQDAEGAWSFRTVSGTTPEGRRALVIWRRLTGDAEADNLVLEHWFRVKQNYSVRDGEFDQIYVNGDCTLENLRIDPENWKVRLIEEDFHRLMFAGAGADTGA